MKLFRIRLMSVTTVLVLLTSCTSVPSTPSIQRVVVFGDSNVDNGNLYRLTDKKRPAPPRWSGRESNGPVVVEYLAKNLNAKLEDLAVSGATTGVSNIIPRIDPTLANVASTGMGQQIEDFAKAGGRLVEADLVVVWAGSNDVFGAKRQDRSDLDKRIATTTGNLEKAVARLQSLRGRHFIVANRSPRDVLGTDNDLNGLDMNAAILTMVRQVRDKSGGDIILYDAYASIFDMVKNPSRYGFTEVVALCVEVPLCASQNIDTGLNVADTYINWDGAHKTTRVHKLMAEQIKGLLTH